MNTRPQEKQEGTRCEVCNISTPTPADQIDHEASLMHHMKLDQFHNGSWHHKCRICRIQAGKLKNYIFHMKGKKHEANLIEEKAKWAGNSEFRTPKTFFLSCHQREPNPKFQNKNHNPHKEMQTKNRNNAPNAPSTSVNKFNVKPPLANPQQQSWLHQAYANVPWSNQNSYNWVPNNFNQQNMQNPFWNNPFQECNWDSGQYNESTWNPESANQWPNNVNNSWGNNITVNSEFQYGYHNPNQSYDQSESNTNIRVLGGNGQDHTTTSNSESAKPTNVEARKKGKAKSLGSKDDLNESRDSNSRRISNARAHSSHSRDSTQSSGRSREIPFSKESSAKSKNKNTTMEGSSKGQKLKKNNEITKSNFKEKKDDTISDSSKSSSVSNSREKFLGKKKNSTGTEKFKRDNCKRVRDGNETTKKTTTCVDEKDNSSPDILEMSKTKNSTDKIHLYFLSSDSDGEGRKSHKLKNKMANIDEHLSVPTTSKKKKGEGSAKSLNHIIISRLVNHPCTPRQQMQLTKWLQAQTASKNLILPSSNLPQSEENNALADVMSELPEDILNDLYEAIEDNEGCKLPEMEVCLNSEPSELESGNIPWVEFLKSLELSKEQEHQEIIEEPNLNKNSVDLAIVKEEIENDNSKPNKETQKDNLKPNKETEKDNSKLNKETEKDNSKPTKGIEKDNSKPNKETEKDNSKPNKEKCTPIGESCVLIKVEPIDSDEIEPTEIKGTSSSLPTKATDITENVNELLQNPTVPPKDSFSGIESELRTSPLPQRPLLSERSTPSSIPRRPPSISSCCLDGTIDRSQKEINDWINNLPANIPDCSGTKEQTPKEHETMSNKNPSQDIIDNLLYLNSQEEQLRDESQKVEQVISQLYRLLEEWKNKRNEIVLQETTFRNRRLKLLESLKGAVSNENTIPLCHETQPSSSNVQYLGTLESTLQFVQELGNDLGLNAPLETSQNIISSTNCDVDLNPDISSKRTKKTKKTSTKTKKKANSDSASLKTTKDLKMNNRKLGQAKKTRKRKDEQTTITSSTSTTKKRKKSKSTNDSQTQESMLEDYMSTVMPEHLGLDTVKLKSKSPKFKKRKSEKQTFCRK